MHRALLVSIGCLFATPLLASTEGMTYADYLKQNGIDPAEAAFVRLAEVTLPVGCDGETLARFVEENALRWSALQRDELARDQASPDGQTQVRLSIVNGQPTASDVTLDSTGSIALMKTLETDFAGLRFSATCSGIADIALRFHLPSEGAPPAASR